ncbi:MAG: hypothetical protein K2G93_00725 [Rikenella sp.]|nr:hypothetical protein [Rikenella sp.]
MYYVGRGGYSWSSTILSENSSTHYIDFNASGIIPNYSSYNADGLQLRCLQE